MDTLVAFLLASVLTFFFVRQYLKTFSATKQAAAGAAPGPAAAPAGAAACPRCGASIGAASAFCPACGASMALWNVHRAAVQTKPANGTSAPPEEKGKPRPVINATLCIGCGSCVDACPETGTLALVSGKAILAHPERCVGHATCVEVCPTSAIILAFGSTLQTMRVPMVKETFETNVTGVYIVGELSGMGLIKTAINEGMLAVDNIKRQLEASGEWNAPAFDPHDGRVAQSNGDSAGRPLDVIIVGAGPAGLSASLAAHQHGLNYLTLEQGEIASTIRNYPRHKFLMAEPIEMPMYGNLYIGDGTKEALLKVWESIVANTGVRIQTQERVESICRDGNVLKVETTKGVYDTRNVVLALGKRGTPRTLGVPGEGLGKVAFKLIEADSYNDEDLLVVGGGDSAIEAALALSKGGKNRVVLAYRGKRFDRARDRNRKSLEEAEEQGKIKVFRESNISEILPASVKLKTPAGETEVPNQYAFILIGGESPEAFLRKMGIEIVEKVLTA